MPLFLKNNRSVEKLASLQAGLKDDILDGWHSHENSQDRRWLMGQLLDARSDGVRPLFVSGDYHKGAISEIWYGKESDSACVRRGEETKSIFGYEILASGLFHEGLAKGLIGKAFDRSESQRVGQHMERSLPSSEGDDYCVDPHVEVSVVRENFGGLTVNDHDPSINDELKLFAGVSKTDTASLFTLVMDWEKKFISKEEKDYGGLWGIWSKLPFTKDTFRPKGIVRDKSLDVCISDLRLKGDVSCDLNNL